MYYVCTILIKTIDFLFLSNTVGILIYKNIYKIGIRTISVSIVLQCLQLVLLVLFIRYKKISFLFYVTPEKS